MKIGVRCNPLKLKSDFTGLVHWLAGEDFDAADLMGVDSEAKRLVENAGLTVGSFDSPHVSQVLSDDPAESRQAAEKLMADLEQAADMGLRTLFACFVPVNQAKPRAENFAIWEAAFPPIVELAEKLGLNIAMEPWPGGAPFYATLGTTPEMWRAMFEAIPSKALGLCYDPSHMVRLGINYIRVLDEFGERIHHVHAKDCAILAENMYLHGRMPPALSRPEFVCSEGWWRYCIPGDGNVDWKSVSERLKCLGYDGPFSIELEDHFYMADEEANRNGLRNARDFLRNLH